MDLFLNIVSLLIISYVSFTFTQMLFKVRKKIILPTNEQEAFGVRRNPEKPVYQPTYSNQKAGIVIYLIVLLIGIAVVLTSIFSQSFWPQSVLLLPILLLSHNLINLFAIGEEGILSGNRFIPWKKIKTFTFHPIDKSHKYYGFSKEVNKGYELKMTTLGFPISCVVTDDKIKGQLKSLLNEYVSRQV